MRLELTLFICFALCGCRVGSHVHQRCVLVDGTAVAPTLVCGRVGESQRIERDIWVRIPSEMPTDGASPIIPWPNDVVPYEGPKELETSVREVAGILATAGYQLRPRREEPDFLVFRTTSWGEAPASFVGRQGGPQALAASPDATAAELLHLVTHALGVAHREARSPSGPDRLAPVALPEDPLTALKLVRESDAALAAVGSSNGTDPDPAVAAAKGCHAAVPDDLRRPCGTIYTIDTYCNALCEGSPSRAAMARFLARRFLEDAGRAVRPDELMLDRLQRDRGLSWIESWRLAIAASASATLPPDMVMPKDLVEAASTCPTFNATFYRKWNRDLTGILTDQDALEHWLTRGILEGRASSPSFHLRAFWLATAGTRPAGVDFMPHAVPVFAAVGPWLFEGGMDGGPVEAAGGLSRKDPDHRRAAVKACEEYR